MRRFTPADIDAALEIDRLAFPRGDQYDRAYYERVAGSKDYDVRVATDAGGTVTGWALADLSRRPLRIRSVSVHPRFRRRGFATTLLRDILQRHYTETDLLLERDNHAAFALYQRLGFVVAAADPEMPHRTRMVWSPTDR